MAHDGLGIVGHVQHATATTRRDMRPGFPLVVSPTLLTDVARRGLLALGRETMVTDTCCG